MKCAFETEHTPRVKGQKGHGLDAPDSFIFTGAVVTVMQRAAPEQQAVLGKFFDHFVAGSQPSQLLVRLFARS
eukprot:1930315-Pyramimonas_sp.AAC.1